MGSTWSSCNEKTRGEFMMSKLDSSLREIITALTDYHNRCTICYRHTNGDNCEKCNEYYLDCTCTPLTPSQITQGVGMD